MCVKRRECDVGIESKSESELRMEGGDVGGGRRGEEVQAGKRCIYPADAAGV